MIQLPRNGVEAPRLLKRSLLQIGMLLLFGTLLGCACACELHTLMQTWRRGPVHAPLAPSQPPPCDGQLAYPRHADANTSSLHQHRLQGDDHQPSTSSKHRGGDSKPKTPCYTRCARVVLLSRTLFRSPPGPPVTSRSSSPIIRNSINISAWSNTNNSDPSPPSVARSATLHQSGRRQLETLPANLVEQYLKGKQRITRIAGYLKSTKSSLRKANRRSVLRPGCKPMSTIFPKSMSQQ